MSARTLDRTLPRAWDRVRLSGDHESQLEQLDTVLSGLGTPLHVFRNHPFWKPFDVDPKRPPGRSGGTGLNSLHIDCVNMSKPPDFVVLHCVKADPAGGGGSLVVEWEPVLAQLTSASRELLEQAIFSDGGAHDLSDVGHDINPFPVIDTANKLLRYTGRLAEDRPNDAHRMALLELDRLLMLNAASFILASGEALIIDQRRALHGRLPLGEGQESLDPSERRLLVQAFARSAA